MIDKSSFGSLCFYQEQNTGVLALYTQFVRVTLANVILTFSSTPGARATSNDLDMLETSQSKAKRPCQEQPEFSDKRFCVAAHTSIKHEYPRLPTPQERIHLQCVFWVLSLPRQPTGPTGRALQNKSVTQTNKTEYLAQRTMQSALHYPHTI